MPVTTLFYLDSFRQQMQHKTLLNCVTIMTPILTTWRKSWNNMATKKNPTQKLIHLCLIKMNMQLSVLIQYHRKPIKTDHH